MRLLLIDDHPLIHLALRALLADFRPAVALHPVLDAQAARAALAPGHGFELVLLDLQLDLDDGFAFLDELRSSHPELPIAVMSASDAMSDVIRAIDQGAMAYIPKTADPQLMKDALQLVVSGGIYVPSMRMTSVPPPPAPGQGPVQAPPPPRPPALTALAITPRQHEVMHLLLLGKPNKLIASELGISADTVKDHVQAIFRALGVHTRTQAVLAVSQMGASPGG